MGIQHFLCSSCTSLVQGQEGPHANLRILQYYNQQQNNTVWAQGLKGGKRSGEIKGKLKPHISLPRLPEFLAAKSADGLVKVCPVS